MKWVATFCLLLCLNASGATWYVSTNGDDGYTTNQAQNPATPYLTVQKGVNMAQAGDTVLVSQGIYGENVSAARSGTPESPIVIDGQNVAQLWSFQTTKSNNYFCNFTIAGKASSWWFYMGKGGHRTVVSNNVFDGAYNTNMTYMLLWDNPYNTTTPPQTPFFTNCASSCVVISNVFKRQVGGTVCVMHGDNNLFYGNLLIDGDACDWFNIWGRSNRIANNVCSNNFQSGLKNNHPDFVQASGGNEIGSMGHIFENNLVVAGHGDFQLLMTAGAVTNGQTFEDWTFRNNKFVGISKQGAASIPKLKFYNNLFYRCATNAGGNYPLIFSYNTNTTYTNLAWCAGHGGEVINNVFIDCGGTNTHNQGYYFYNYITNSPKADYNFISYSNAPIAENTNHQSVGDVGGWDVYSWWEEHGINGGDPVFVDAGGFDFRLLTNSPLVGMATNLSDLFVTDFNGVTRGSTWDIGPYKVSEYEVYPDLPCDVGPKTIRAYSRIGVDSISLYWPANEYRQQLLIHRRNYTNNPSQWQPWTNAINSITDPAVAALASGFTDTNVTIGVPYEYRISVLVTNYECSYRTVIPYWYYDYLNTGIGVPLTDVRGKVVLLVESGVGSSLTNELGTLTNDLIGDGYSVFRHDVAAVDVDVEGWFTAVTNTKALIRVDYNTDTNSNWNIFIVGHVPIPYSGLSGPGGHTNNFGAHPADWYYADMSSETNWTDSTANDVTGEYSVQHNVPGDGKFDQSTIPTAPEMRIGRVDFRNMPAFAKSEAELLRQYLDRDHAWRHKQFTVRNLGIINSNNNAGLIYRGMPADAHDVHASFFGNGMENAVVLGSWLKDAGSTNNSFLLAASYGNGEYARDDQIGYTTDFAATNLYAVFTEMYGSYYGDWDSSQRTNAVLLAPIASGGYALSSFYRETIINLGAAAICEPIGSDLYFQAASSFRGTSTCYYAFGQTNVGSSGISMPLPKCYVTLLGDPTLRMRAVAPPTNVVATTNGSDVALSWTAAIDSDIQGYHVYRASATDLNSFTRLTETPTALIAYTNTGGAMNAYTYMVRTVKLEQSPNRSYYNASQGVFSQGGANTAPPGTNNSVRFGATRITTMRGR